MNVGTLTRVIERRYIGSDTYAVVYEDKDGNQHMTFEKRYI